MTNDTMSNSDKLIILKSVYGKTGIKVTVMPCPNPRTGRFPDCVKRVDSHGDMILSESDKEIDTWIPINQTFELVDGTTFNLDDPYDAAKWEAIKFCPLIAPDRFAKDASGNSLIDGTPGSTSLKPRYGIAELYVYHPGEFAVRKVTKKKLQHQAISYILDDKKGKDGHLFICRLLGKNMNNQTSADIEDFLIQQAEKNPQKIIDLYTGSDTSLRMLFMDAVDRHVIVLRDKLYTYSDSIVLGATDDAAIAWLKDKKNQRAVELIRKDTYPEYEEDVEEITTSVDDVTSKSSKTSKK